MRAHLIAPRPTRLRLQQLFQLVSISEDGKEMYGAAPIVALAFAEVGEDGEVGCRVDVPHGDLVVRPAADEGEVACGEGAGGDVELCGAEDEADAGGLEVEESAEDEEGQAEDGPGRAVVDEEAAEEGEDGGEAQVGADDLGAGAEVEGSVFHVHCCLVRGRGGHAEGGGAGAVGDGVRSDGERGCGGEGGCAAG